MYIHIRGSAEPSYVGNFGSLGLCNVGFVDVVDPISTADAFVSASLLLEPVIGGCGSVRRASLRTATLPVPLLGLTVETLLRSAPTVGEWIQLIGQMLSPFDEIGRILPGLHLDAVTVLLAARYMNLAALETPAVRDAEDRRCTLYILYILLTIY